MKAEYVNPFSLSVCKVVKEVCMIDLRIGKPGVRPETYDDDASIIELGLTGGLSGRVVLNMEHPTALEIISKMMMQPVETIDEIGRSAISELGNMIAGNADTEIASNNIMIDITPPDYHEGGQYCGKGQQMLSIPFQSDAGAISVDIAIAE